MPKTRNSIPIWKNDKPSLSQVAKIAESWIDENADSIPTHHVADIVNWLLAEIRRLRKLKRA